LHGPADDSRAARTYMAAMTNAETSIDAEGEASGAQACVYRFGMDQPLHLDSGVKLAPVEIAYQTYGTLNADKSNAVLICHALTGDQHAANRHPVTGKDGWWHRMVGPGRPIDTDRFFVICQNVIGGCSGTTGPTAINPETNKPYGLDFPVINSCSMPSASTSMAWARTMSPMVMTGKSSP